ncbi:hypothetical protein G3R49_12085 [Shewanella sp. WXL01]|uniref:hypothetical protein n=1 Tax=Shewanella sp. WXL01 TaxID=2709721 RepID=UPI0014383A7E|nr:hypothetical protein [Shewanella sp. WXL01]NKF51295.1 hypothetical protein [Shewanella sp. WXL01]
MWNRFDSAIHIINNQKWSFRYDRFTSAISLNVGEHRKVSKEGNNSDNSHVTVVRSFSYFAPKRKINFSYQGQQYQLSISWLLLWRSQLLEHSAESTSVVIKEVFTKRRRRSITIGCYVALLSAIKLGLMYAHA